ncbi:MAG: hypothetical protein K1000chlam2_00030 [Chlamydiae bacterium]|nr:hypothetical protein [Chlamydiota bacterium]
MIECKKFKYHEKGNLVGFADLYIEKWEAEIVGCAYFKKGNSRWISLPGKEYEKDGEKKYLPFLRFTRKQVWQAFMDQASHAIQEHLSSLQPEENGNQ